jgi:hypothetical protein
LDQDRLALRALDPKIDIDLFREAYHWRKQKTSKLRPDRMSFEDFAADDPSQIVMGLFKGPLCAIYLFREGTRGTFDAHFTSRRDVPREYVVAGGRWMVRWFMENGAQEISAFVIQQNGPLCRFVEDVGFIADGVSVFPCNPAGHSDTLPLQTKELVHYAIRR